MGILSRTRFRIIKKWRKYRLKKNKPPLREFVYLDEVSVYSLNASRLGSIATEMTETRTASLQSEVGGSLGSGPSPISTGISSRTTAGRSRESQVVRKSVVQTAFKEFYELEVDLDSFGMRSGAPSGKLPSINNLDKLADKKDELKSSGFAVDPQELARGHLIEVDVELEAEDIFRVSAVVSAIERIVKDEPSMFGLDVNKELGQMRSINRILEGLLFELVPIRGRARDYVVAEIEGKEWIVRRELLDTLPQANNLTTYSLYVVGVADQALFWKDLRRVLFSKASYSVLCRLARADLQVSWTPVKMGHVLRSLDEDLANHIDSLATNAFELSDGNVPEPHSKEQLMKTALVDYAEQLGEHYDQSITSEALSESDLPAQEHYQAFDDETRRRRAFHDITEFVGAKIDQTIDEGVASMYRKQALENNNLTWASDNASVRESNTETSATPKARYLDSEFIAIYW